jgi:hypothetical protein
MLLQTPPPVPAVVVGLTDGRQVVLADPEFTGFMYGRSAQAVLTYRSDKIHGLLSVDAIARIDFGEYNKNEPFAMTITLKNGQKLQAWPERSNFLTVRGNNGTGTVLIKHPDPVATPLRLTGKRPNRKNDLTIQYLEFPAPTE